MEADALLDCASETFAGRDFAPGAVTTFTVDWNEKMSSPGLTSPCVPSSKKGCAADPPIELRSAVTAIPVLVGFDPGVTVTLSNVEFPATTVEGLAFPVAAGSVGAGVTVREMEVEALLACASLTPMVSDFPPDVVATFTVA